MINNAKKAILSGNYVAGFVDGEGCFDLQFRKDIKYKRINKPVYYSWKVQFAIVLREDDEDLLKKVQAILNCGYIYHARNNQVRYSVQDIENLHNIIVPFFKKYPLFGKKGEDFELWSEAIDIIYRNKRKTINIKRGIRGFIKINWNKNDFQRLIKVHKLMQKYKAKRFKGFKWTPKVESMININGKNFKE